MEVLRDSNLNLLPIGHVLSFVFSGLVHCMEICARIFIPFCYWNSANKVNLATIRVWGRLQGSLETTNSDLLELLDDNDKY